MCNSAVAHADNNFSIVKFMYQVLGPLLNDGLDHEMELNFSFLHQL